MHALNLFGCILVHDHCATKEASIKPAQLSIRSRVKWPMVVPKKFQLDSQDKKKTQAWGLPEKVFPSRSGKILSNDTSIYKCNSLISRKKRRPKEQWIKLQSKVRRDCQVSWLRNCLEGNFTL